MRQDHRFRKKKGLPDDQKRLLSAAVIPLVVIVLIIVIVIADHKKEAPETVEPSATAAEEMSGSASGLPEEGGAEDEEGLQNGEEGRTVPDLEPGESPEETEESTEADPAADGELSGFETENFRRDSVPEILDLMKTYFQARALADAETINKLYGIGEVSVEALEAQKTRMRNNSKYISGFQNIATYVMDGVSEDQWLVYTVFDIKFYSVKTLAPMMMYCYVQKDSDGNYRILDNGQLPGEVAAFIETANRSQEVRSLAAAVNGGLREALTEDADLSAVYGVIRDGSPVWEEEAETEAAVVVLDGSEAEEEAMVPSSEAGQ